MNKEEIETFRNRITERFLPVISDLSGSLGDDTTNILTEFIENFEFGVALDWLKDAIVHQNIQISDTQKKDIQQIEEYLEQN